MVFWVILLQESIFAVEHPEVHHSHGRRRARTALVATAAVLGLAATAVAVVVLPGEPAQAATATSCGSVDLFVNAGGGSRDLRRLDPVTRTWRTTPGVVPLSKDYGDIAFRNDGSVLYGIDFGSASLDRIDPATGAATPVPLTTGASLLPGGLNGLSALPSGSLLVGSWTTSSLYEIDPATGVVTTSAWQLPSGSASGGDFLTLDDGDVLALASAGGSSFLVRLDAAGAPPVRIGDVPRSHGMGQVSGRVMLATSDGRVLVVTDLAPRGTGVALPYDVVATASPGASFYGATTVQDAGSCNALVASTSASTFPAGTRPVFTVGGLAPTATGTVTFATGATPLCTVTLPARSCTGPLLPPGTYATTATWSADGQTSTSSFTVLQPPPVALQPQTVKLAVPASVSLTSRTLQATATASAGGATTWTTSDPSVATVDANGLVTLHAAGHVVVTARAAATATHEAATSSSTVEVVLPPARALPRGASRLAGPDRVHTALQASQEVYGTPAAGRATDVVIATSGTYADAISGARLAGQVQGPLLLTPADHLDGEVAAEARRLAGTSGTVYLLGQTEALATAVETDLRARSTGYRVVRLGGTDRYETAVAVAGEVTARAGTTGPIYLVTGTDFADGVCVAPYAQRTGGVVLLTRGSTTPPSTAAYLAGNDPSGARVVAVGGAAVAARAASGTPAATSIVGRDRYETAAQLAWRFTTQRGVDGTTGVAVFGLAGGDSWPDALTGAAAMSHLDGPLLLTATGTGELSLQTRLALDGLAVDAASAVVFGGRGAVSDGALRGADAVVKR